MPLTIIISILVIVAIITLIIAVKKNWFKCLSNKALDCFVLVLVFISLVFSIGLLNGIANYVSEYNVPIQRVVGGLVFNLALFIIPAVLFIAFIILLIKILQSSNSGE